MSASEIRASRRPPATRSSSNLRTTRRGAASARRGACRPATRSRRRRRRRPARCTRALRRLRARPGPPWRSAGCGGRTDRLRGRRPRRRRRRETRCATSASFGDAGFAHRDEAGAARSEEHEDAELLVTLDLAREARARRDRPLRRRRPPARADPSGTSATPIRFLSRSMLRISNGTVIPATTGFDQPSARPVGANVDTCASASTPGSSSTNAPNSVMRVTRPVRTWPTLIPVGDGSTTDRRSAASTRARSSARPRRRAAP